MKELQQFLRWAVIGGVFLLPFIPFLVANSLFFPYITGKNFTFRIIVEIIAALALALALSSPAYRPKRSWILAVYAIFVLVIGIADVQGAYWFKSIWSNFERMEGWVTLAHLLAYLLVLAAVMHTESLWRRLFQTSLVASLLLSILGFMQVLGAAALNQGGSAGLTARIDATFGNPIYLAAYMLFHVFLAAMLWVQTTREVPAERRFWPSLFYVVVIILDTLALFLTSTRGAILGLIGGAFLTLILLSLRKEARRIRIITVSALILIAVAGASLRAAQGTPFVQSIGFLSRLSSISLSDATTKARFLNMGIAWQGVKERPLLGWGQENYALVFDKYYDPRMYAQEQWFDRVHNSLFDWWIAGGTLGLLAFLSIFSVALWVLWRPRKDGKQTFTFEESAVLTGLLAGYFFHNLTVFDNLTSSILFVTVFGYIAHREAAASRPLYEGKILPLGAIVMAAPILFLSGLAAAWMINQPAYVSNRAIIQGLSALPGGPQENLAMLERAILYRTFGSQEAREQLAQLAIQGVGAPDDQIAKDVKKRFVDIAVRELDEQASASPMDARFPLFAGGVLNAAGDYAGAAQKLEAAHKLSPRKQTILYQMGQNAMQMGDTSTALKNFKEAFEAAPENTTARLLYASLLISLAHDTEADGVLAPIIPTGQAADQRILQAYAARQQYSKIIPIWKAHVEAQPQDKGAYLTLAGAYYLTGDTRNAIATLEQYEQFGAEEKNQAAQLKLQIESGTLKVQ